MSSRASASWNCATPATRRSWPQSYDREGGDELVFLDITASSDSRDTMVDVVHRVSEEVFIPLTVGGGIRTVEDIRRMLKAGADKVSLNTAAVNNPALIGEGAVQFGNQCIVVAIDAKRVVPYPSGGGLETALASLRFQPGAGRQFPLGGVYPRGPYAHWH